MRLADADVGMLRGLWGVAVDGYVWDDQTQALPTPPAEREHLNKDQGPWLRPADSSPQANARVYPVLRKPRVFRDFIALSRDPTRDKIQAFANTWGMLTAGVIRTGRHLTNGWIAAESLRDWQTALMDFRLLWETWEAVRALLHGDSHSTSSQRNASRLLRGRITWRNRDTTVGYHAELPEGGFRTWVLAHPGYHEDLLEAFKPGDVLGPARYYVHMELTERLRRRVNLVVGFTGASGHDTQMRYSPSDLVTAMYVHFALDVAGARGEERICAACNHPFLPRRRDQRFCGKLCRERAGYHRRKEGA